MALSTDTRQELTQWLRDQGLPAHASVPPTVSLPSVILVPDSPYLTPNRVGAQLSYQLALRIHCVAAATDNAAGLAAVEALIDQTLTALPTTVNVERVDPPQLDNLGAQGAAYVAEITTTLQVEKG